MNLGQVVAAMAEELVEQRRMGMEFAKAEADRDVRALVACYDKAIHDPKTKIPTYLHMAMEALRAKYAPR